MDTNNILCEMLNLISLYVKVKRKKELPSIRENTQIN